MKRLLSRFDTFMMPATFAEANEHETGRQLLTEKTVEKHYPKAFCPEQPTGIGNSDHLMPKTAHTGS